jgi:hypothetical protein
LKQKVKDLEQENAELKKRLEDKQQPAPSTSLAPALPLLKLSVAELLLTPPDMIEGANVRITGKPVEVHPDKIVFHEGGANYKAWALMDTKAAGIKEVQLVTVEGKIHRMNYVLRIENAKVVTQP